MKKLFIIMALFLGLACGANAEDKVTAKVSGNSLKIGLENATTFCAFQMDITLPAGVTASEVKAVANRLSDQGSDSEIGGTKFIVASNTLDGNVLRVIAYNLANAQITGATGDILNITLNSAVADPTQIKVSNILFVNKEDLKDVAISDATGENGAAIGDVYEDGVIDISDVSATLNIINKQSLSSKVNKNNADVYADGVIDVTDVSAILKILNIINRK